MELDELERLHLPVETNAGVVCYTDGDPWPCDMVALLPYVRRLQAVAEAARDHHAATWCVCDTGDEEMCEMAAALAALGEESR